MTTIEALNETGVVYAIQDGVGHVSVILLEERLKIGIMQAIHQCGRLL